MKYHILYCLENPVSKKNMRSSNNPYIDFLKNPTKFELYWRTLLLFANAIKIVVCTKQNSSGFNQKKNEIT